MREQALPQQMLCVSHTVQEQQPRLAQQGNATHMLLHLCKRSPLLYVIPASTLPLQDSRAALQH